MLLVAIPALVLAGAAALVMVPWDKEVIYEPLVRDPSPTQNSGPINAPSYKRSTIHFPAKDGTRLEAWLYRPKVHSSPFLLLFQDCVTVLGTLGAQRGEAAWLLSARGRRAWRGRQSSFWATASAARRTWRCMALQTALRPTAWPR